MDSQSILTLLTLTFLVLLSAYFSATETAFSALSRARLKTMADKGSRYASLALKLHDNYDTLISTILTGSTIVNLTAASMSAAFFIRQFGDIGATLSAVVITVVVLVAAEVTPKSLAKESPEKIAIFSSPILRFMILLLTPFNFLFSKWKRLLNSITKTSAEDRVITDEELMSMVDEMELDGEIDEEDRQLIHNAIEFKDVKAEDILTPRVKIEAISKNASADEIGDLFLSTGFSRIPLYDESVDNIVGIVHLRDFFKFVIQKNIPLEDIITEPVYIAPSMEITNVVKELQRKKSHIAVVADEYGGTAGIVTMEDILEELVGEIWDESDDIIEEFIPLGDNKYKVMCEADIEKMFEFFSINPGAEESDALTVNGWIMDKLGKIPEEGDTLEYENLLITVHKTEHRRVLECVVDVGGASSELFAGE